MIATQQYSPERTRSVIQNCFADLIADAETQGGFVPRTSEPGMERAEQAFLSTEAEGALRKQIATCNFDGFVLEQAAASLTRRGVKLDQLSLSIRQTCPPASREPWSRLNACFS